MSDSIFAVGVFFTVFTAIAFSLRVYTKCLNDSNLGLDDLLLFLAIFCFDIENAIQLYCLKLAHNIESTTDPLYDIYFQVRASEVYSASQLTCLSGSGSAQRSRYQLSPLSNSRSSSSIAAFLLPHAGSAFPHFVCSLWLLFTVSAVPWARSSNARRHDQAGVRMPATLLAACQRKSTGCGSCRMSSLTPFWTSSS